MTGLEKLRENIMNWCGKFKEGSFWINKGQLDYEIDRLIAEEEKAKEQGLVKELREWVKDWYVDRNSAYKDREFLKILSKYEVAEGKSEEPLAVLAESKGIIENLLDSLPEIPEKNCFCHINPPCSDCENYGALREAVTEAREYLNGLKDKELK